MILFARVETQPAVLHHASRTLAVTVLAVGVACAAHAALQYHYLYDQHLTEFETSISGDPTPTQLGLLHHFRIKRVASVWGDPNILGCICALSVLAALFLVQQARRVRRYAMAATLAFGAALCLYALFLTGSRGAWLDLILGLILLWLVPLRDRQRNITPAMALVLLTVCATSTKAQVEEGRYARPGTIRERLNYYSVAAEVIKLNPIAGSGPGAIDRYYGRLKAPGARESKFVHNWVLQYAAEFGAIGVSLLFAFLAYAAWRYVRSTELNAPASGFLPVLAAVVIFDGLIQLSYSNREIMALVGFALGGIVAMGARIAPGSRLGLLGFVAPALLSVAIAVLVLPSLMGTYYKQAAEDAVDGANPAAARLFLRRAESWNRRDPMIYSMLGQLSASGGDLLAATLHTRQALRLRPDSASLRAQLAEYLSRQGKRKLAIDELGAALSFYPTNAEYHYQLALLLEHAGDTAAALKHAQEAAKHGYLYADRYSDYLKKLESGR